MLVGSPMVNRNPMDLGLFIVKAVNLGRILLIDSMSPNKSQKMQEAWFEQSKTIWDFARAATLSLLANLNAYL